MPKSMNFISFEGMEQLSVSRETCYIYFCSLEKYVCMSPMISLYLRNSVLLRIFIEGIEIKFKDAAFSREECFIIKI